MRVIAGTAKRTQLKTLDGMNTRPTTDRIKETLFNMIDPWIRDCDFLDIFAGSGAIGIEALSRGANQAVFIENHRKAVEIINENLKKTRLDSRGIVLCADAVTGLRRLEGKYEFDYIFMDPPYNHLLEKQVLIALSELHLLSEVGLIIVEASLETSFDYLSDIGFHIVKEKLYKTNKHVFIEPEIIEE